MALPPMGERGGHLPDPPERIGHYLVPFALLRRAQAMPRSEGAPPSRTALKGKKSGHVDATIGDARLSLCRLDNTA